MCKESAEAANEERRRVGLCLTCRHIRKQDTKRGAVFYRCALADEDDRFMRYPPMPVSRCDGFAAED